MANQNSLESASVPRARNGKEGLACGVWAGGVRLEAFANLAHELRTPLQVLLGYLDILREEWGERFGNEPRQILQRMNASAHQLAQTVENLMEFAAAETGAEARVEEEVAIRDLIAELAPTFEAANESKGLVLKFDLEDAPARFRSQRRPLRLILQNLVLNAIKFTAVGTVTVTVRRFRAGKVPIGVVEFEVRDTGTGINPEQIELACEPFTQLSRSSIRRYRGVGLGLAVVRRNVAALGGVLEAHSRPGVGSIFTLRIPSGPREYTNGSVAIEHRNGSANGHHRNGSASNGRWAGMTPPIAFHR